MKKRTKNTITKKGKSNKITFNTKTALNKLKCKCGKLLIVGDNAVSVVCGDCTSYDMLRIYGLPKKAEPKKPNGFAQGWKFMKQFVHADGRVFELGKENISLKGTLEPTVIKPPTKRRKKKDIDAEKQAKLVKKFEKKVVEQKKREKKLKAKKLKDRFF